MVALVGFRTCLQREDESLADYVTRLRPLAGAAGIKTEDVEAEILSVVSTNTYSHEIRMKCLDASTKLDGLLEWSRALSLRDQCAAKIESKLPTNFNVNRIGTPVQSHLRTARIKCNNCGYNHGVDKECPAKGKQCNKCKKYNHFGQVCRSAGHNASHTT